MTLVSVQIALSAGHRFQMITNSHDGGQLTMSQIRI